MTVSETLGALGSWDLKLADDCPDEVLRQLGYFGHVVILRGDVDVTQADPTTLLRSARYVGVLRAKPTDARTLEGSGMRFWLGDEDNKGQVRETKLDLTGKTLAQCVPLIVPPAVHTGTVNTAAGTYTGTHQWETPRQTLDTVSTAFGVEYRINGDATVDVGTQAQLYRATPTTILSARGAGADLDVKSIGTDFQPGSSAVDYTTRAVLLGQTTDQQTIVEATADAPSVPYADMWGNAVAFTRAISDSGQTTGSATAAVQLQLNRFNRLTTAVKVTAEDYEIAGEVVVGDNAWVYDPDNGILDTSHELDFGGEKINPAVVRISAATWPVTSGHTVAFRTQAGTIVDLTRWVAWESGTTDLTIGDLPKTLTSPGNPVQDRANSVPDGSVPAAPTGLTLATAAVQSSKGNVTATISASWTAPPLNTDGSVVTDLSYYVVQYRWQGRAPLWTTLQSPVTTIDIPGLSVGLVYDVQVAAVDLTGHVSAFTAVSSITAAPDSTAPNPPSDPTVTSYLGQLRIAWDGKDNTGSAMPPDFAVVEVHVSATSGFTPVSGPGSTTLVDQLSTAGVSYATAPYGAARFVKLVAVDNSFNRSAPSGQVSGATAQAGDGDIAALSVGKLTAGTMSADVVVSGRFATALTGGRVEMNSLGFQKFDTDGVTKLVSITGTEALLTGVYKSAASGRRIEVGAAGSTGQIDFYAPDGTKSILLAYTETTGLEAMQFGIPISAASSNLWNRINYNNDHGGYSNYRANKHEFIFGGVNNASGSDSANPGFFHVLQTSNYGASLNTERFRIDSAFLGYWDATGTVRISIDSSSHKLWDSAGHERLVIDMAGSAVWDTNGRQTYGLDGAGSQRIYGTSGWNGNGYVSGSNLQITGPFSVLSGPYLTYWTPPQPSGGLIYGGLQLFTMDSPGVNEHFQFMHWDGSIYIGVWASAFTVSSDVNGKTNVADFAGDALAAVRSVKVKTYQRKPGANMPVGPTEIGLLAQDAPAQIVTQKAGEPHGVDLYQMSALEWRAIQQLEARLAALEGKGRAA